jgi:hypothetical protein
VAVSFIVGGNRRKPPETRHFGTVEKKCQIGTAFSFKYKLGKSYIELFIFILIFFGPHQNDIATTKIMKKAG